MWDKARLPPKAINYSNAYSPFAGRVFKDDTMKISIL